LKKGDLLIVDDSGFAVNGNLPGALVKYYLDDLSILGEGQAIEQQSMGAGIVGGPSYVVTAETKGYFKFHGKSTFGWDTHFWIGDRTSHDIKQAGGFSSRRRALLRLKEVLSATPCYAFMFNKFGVPCPIQEGPKTVAKLASELTSYNLPLTCDFTVEKGVAHVFPGSRSLNELDPTLLVATPIKYTIGGRLTRKIVFDIDLFGKQTTKKLVGLDKRDEHTHAETKKRKEKKVDVKGKQSIINVSDPYDTSIPGYIEYTAQVDTDVDSHEPIMKLKGVSRVVATSHAEHIDPTPEKRSTSQTVYQPDTSTTTIDPVRSSEHVHTEGKTESEETAQESGSSGKLTTELMVSTGMWAIIANANLDTSQLASLLEEEQKLSSTPGFPTRVVHIEHGKVVEISPPGRNRTVEYLPHVLCLVACLTSFLRDPLYSVGILTLAFILAFLIWVASNNAILLTIDGSNELSEGELAKNIVKANKYKYPVSSGGNPLYLRSDGGETTLEEMQRECEVDARTARAINKAFDEEVYPDVGEFQQRDYLDRRYVFKMVFFFVIALIFLTVSRLVYVAIDFDWTSLPKPRWPSPHPEPPLPPDWPPRVPEPPPEQPAYPGPRINIPDFKMRLNFTDFNVTKTLDTLEDFLHMLKHTTRPKELLEDIISMWYYRTERAIAVTICFVIAFMIIRIVWRFFASMFVIRRESDYSYRASVQKPQKSFPLIKVSLCIALLIVACSSISVERAQSLYGLYRKEEPVIIVQAPQPKPSVFKWVSATIGSLVFAIGSAFAIYCRIDAIVRRATVALTALGYAIKAWNNNLHILSSREVIDAVATKKGLNIIPDETGHKSKKTAFDAVMSSQVINIEFTSFGQTGNVRGFITDGSLVTCYHQLCARPIIDQDGKEWKPTTVDVQQDYVVYGRDLTFATPEYKELCFIPTEEADTGMMIGVVAKTPSGDFCVVSPFKKGHSGSPLITLNGFIGVQNVVIATQGPGDLSEFAKAEDYFLGANLLPGARERVEASFQKAIMCDANGLVKVVAGTGTGKSTRLPIGVHERLKSEAGTTSTVVLMTPMRVPADNAGKMLSINLKEKCINSSVFVRHSGEDFGTKKPGQIRVYTTASIVNSICTMGWDSYMRMNSDISSFIIDEVHVLDAATQFMRLTVEDKERRANKRWITTTATPIDGKASLDTPFQITDRVTKFDILAWSKATTKVRPPKEVIGSTEENVIWFLPSINSCGAAKKKLEALGYRVISFTSEDTADRINFSNTVRDIWAEWDEGRNKKFIVVATSAAETGVTLPVHICVSSGYMITPTKIDSYGYSLVRSTQQVLIQQRGRVGRKFEGTHLVCGNEVTDVTELLEIWSDSELVELMCANAGVKTAGLRPTVYEDAMSLHPVKRSVMQITGLPYDFARFIVSDDGSIPSDLSRFLHSLNPKGVPIRSRAQSMADCVAKCEEFDYSDSVTKKRFRVRSPCSPSTLPLEVAQLIRVGSEEVYTDEDLVVPSVSGVKYSFPVKGGVQTSWLSDTLTDWAGLPKDDVARVIRTQNVSRFFTATGVAADFQAKVKKEYGYEMAPIDVSETFDCDIGIPSYCIDESKMELECDGETVTFKVTPKQSVGPAHGITSEYLMHARSAYLDRERANDVYTSTQQEVDPEASKSQTAIFDNVMFRTTESLIWLFFAMFVILIWCVIAFSSSESAKGFFWLVINPLGLTFFAQSALLAPMSIYAVCVKAAHEVGWKKGLANGAKKIHLQRQRTSSLGSFLSFLLGPGFGDLIFIFVAKQVSDYSITITTEAADRAFALSQMGNFATERAWNEEMGGDDYPLKRKREAELSLASLCAIMLVVSPLLTVFVLGAAYAIHKNKIFSPDIHNSLESCLVYSFSIFAPIVLNFLHFRLLSAILCGLSSLIVYTVAEQCTVATASRLMVVSSVVMMRITGYASVVSYSGILTSGGTEGSITVAKRTHFTTRPLNKHRGQSFLSSSVRITDYEKLQWDRKAINVQSLRACSRQHDEERAYSDIKRQQLSSSSPHAYLNFIAMTKVVSGLLPNPVYKSVDLTFGDGSLYAAIYDLCGREVNYNITCGDRRRFGNAIYAETTSMSWDILKEVYPYVDECGMFYALHHNVEPMNNAELLKNLYRNSLLMSEGSSVLLLVRKPDIADLGILTKLSTRFKSIRCFESPREFCCDGRVYMHFEACGDYDEAPSHYFTGMINEVKELSYRIEEVDLENADLYMNRFKRDHVKRVVKKNYVDSAGTKLQRMLDECDVDTWTNDTNLAADFKKILSAEIFDSLPDHKRATVYEVLVNPLRRAHNLELKNTTFRRLIRSGLGCTEIRANYGTLPSYFNIPGMARPDMRANYARVHEVEKILMAYEPEKVSMIKGASVENDIFSHAISTRCGSPYSGKWDDVEQIYKLCLAGKYLRAKIEKSFERIGKVRCMTKEEIIPSLNKQSTITASEKIEFGVQTLGEAIELPAFWEKVYRQLDGYLTTGEIDCGYNLIPKVEKRGNLKAKHFLGDRVIPRAIECLAGSTRVATMMLFMDFSHKLYGGEIRPVKNFTNGLRQYDVSKLIHQAFTRYKNPAQLTGDKSQWDSTFNVMLFAICYYVAEGAFDDSVVQALYRDFKVNMFATFLDKLGNVTMCFGQMKSGSWNTSSFNGLCGWLLSIFLGMEAFGISPEEVDERVEIKIEGDDSVFIGTREDIKKMFNNLYKLLQFGPRLADYDQIYGETPESCRYLSHSYTRIGDTYWAIRPVSELLPKMCMITDISEDHSLFGRKVCEMAMGFMVSYYVIPEIREVCYQLLNTYAESQGTEYRVYESYKGVNLMIKPNNIQYILSRLHGVQLPKNVSVEPRTEVLEVLSLGLRQRITSQMVRDAMRSGVADLGDFEFSVHETAYKAPLRVRVKERVRRRGNYVLATNWRVIEAVVNIIGEKDSEIKRKMEELYLNRARHEWTRQKKHGTAYRGTTPVDIHTANYLALWQDKVPPSRASPFVKKVSSLDVLRWTLFAIATAELCSILLN
jgi:hypothetical protein